MLFSLKNEKNPAICNNMDKPGERYAKRNKPYIQRQTLYGCTYVEPENAKLLEAESKVKW